MSKQIRLDDGVYERIKSIKHDDESFSDLRDVFDDNQVNEMRAAIEETTAEPDR
jgi:predicted CopG family antitoxin